MKNTRLRRFRGNQMNPDYYDFDYDKFVKYICSNLSDVKKSDVYLDETTYVDVSIAYVYDDSEGIASWLANKSDYAEYIDILGLTKDEITEVPAVEGVVRVRVIKRD